MDVNVCDTHAHSTGCELSYVTRLELYNETAHLRDAERIFQF